MLLRVYRVYVCCLINNSEPFKKLVAQFGALHKRRTTAKRQNIRMSNTMSCEFLAKSTFFSNVITALYHQFAFANIYTSTHVMHTLGTFCGVNDAGVEPSHGKQTH